MNHFVLLVFTMAYSCTNGAFILFPSELLPVAELLYSRLPPVTAGVDSKVGFGFRIGRNADAQVLFELGPQKYTTYSNAATGSDKAKRNDVNRFRSFPSISQLRSSSLHSKPSEIKSWKIPVFSGKSTLRDLQDNRVK